jgi:hypothetical protein
MRAGRRPRLGRVGPECSRTAVLNLNLDCIGICWTAVSRCVLEYTAVLNLVLVLA